jgi:hypothetical protein
MKTLIIHPKDLSTVFLTGIYDLIPKEDKTVVSGGVSSDELAEMIKSHDRVMMMGHGSPSGLFKIGNFPRISDAYLINKKHVELLNKKEENVFIWCNADMFVSFYELKGLWTGMFISEVSEASFCGLHRITQDIIDESNYGFSNILRECVAEGKEVSYKVLKERYGELAETNPVALYNNIRLYKQ